MNKLIIFDLDGVLLDSCMMHYETLNEALEFCGRAPISLDDHKTRFNGLPTRTKLQMLWIPPSDIEEISVEKQRRTLGWIMKNVKENETLVSLFRDLRLRGWMIAVASNAVTMTVVCALQLIGVKPLCDFIIAGDRVSKPKPNPEIYQACMEFCGVEPASTWIIEDSEIGIEGARRTGATVIPVEGPHEVPVKVQVLMEEMV